MQTRTIVKHEQNGGAECVNWRKHNVKETDCNTDDCPPGNSFRIAHKLVTLLKNKINDQYRKKYISSFACFITVTCDCTSPGKGEGYMNNKMNCTDGSVAYCALNEECYATESFEYGKLYEGCRLPGNILALSKYVALDFST